VERLEGRVWAPASATENRRHVARISVVFNMVCS
jgi:hypothetical protein